MPKIPIWLRGSTMLSAAAMGWGGMFAVVKPLLAGMDPFILTLIRYGLAAPIFLALLWAVEGRSALTTAGRTLRLWWLGTMGFAGFGLFILVGVGMTQPEHASVVPRDNTVDLGRGDRAAAACLARASGLRLGRSA